MKKGIKTLLAVLFLSALTLSSCSKDDDNNPATCSNGVLDGDETGIDCGGSCNACNSTPSCTNGVMDGNETGIDCGGSCTACVPAITKTYYFKGNVDGDSVIYQSNAYESGGGSSSGGGTCILDLGGVITQSGMVSGPLNAFALDFNNVYTGACPAINNQNVLNSIFETGTFTYNDGPNSSQIDIQYVVNNVRYSSLDYGAQTSGTFSIVESVAISPFGSQDGVKIKVVFNNWKLKSSAGNVIDVLNAETVIAIYDWD